jgi:digeranylgeranylglycerophospholipid reductase
MNVKYDLVIVGAGPAGLMAASAAVKEGLKIAILERKKEISKIHRSCGGVLNINEDTFGEVVHFDQGTGDLKFVNSGTTIRYDGPYQDLFGFCLYAPGGGRIEFGDFAELKKDPEKNRLGIALKKGRLIQIMLDEIIAAGVELFPNTNVVSVRKEQAGVVMECEDKRTFTGTFVIAADGINSRLARVMGMNKEREFYGTTRDTSIEIKGCACPASEGFLFMTTKKSIFSMIPLAEEGYYHVYASTFRRDEKPVEMLDYFLKEDPPFSQWYRDSEIIEQERTACVVTLMSPIKKPFKDNVLFVGDACWRREMSNVGSMNSGWKAGKCIAAALSSSNENEEGILEYLDWYDKYYFIPWGVRKQGGRNFNEYLTYEDIDYLVGLCKDKLPPTLDIIKAVNFIGEYYGELMTQIYEERPDTMDRMMVFRENMEPDLEKRLKWGFKLV